MSAKSEALPFEKKRVIVLHQADWICADCGLEATEVDHIWPRRLGGGDEFDNLQALCRTCNARKGSSFYVRSLTPDRCEWVAHNIHHSRAAENVLSASRWLSIRGDLIDGEATGVAYFTYLDDTPGDPRPEAIREVLSQLWVDLLAETPGQAALDALADLDVFIGAGE